MYTCMVAYCVSDYISPAVPSVVVNWILTNPVSRPLLMEAQTMTDSPSFTS